MLFCLVFFLRTKPERTDSLVWSSPSLVRKTASTKTPSVLRDVFVARLISWSLIDTIDFANEEKNALFDTRTVGTVIR